MAKALWILASIPARYATGEDPERGLLECPLASARLRTAVASLEWKKHGNENLFCVPGATRDSRAFDLRDARICVVPKFYFDTPLEPWLAACRAAKRDQCSLVIDVCDYPFEKAPPVRAFYSEALGICDAVVVNSERMAEMIAPHTRHRPLVIEDAILGASSNPEFAPGERLEVLWFGHPVNLHYLDARLEGFARFAREKRCRLTVVTEGSRDAEQWTRNVPARHAFAFETRFVPWSLESLRTALRECDLVLIPSDPADPFKAGASANRIAEALNAGRFPVASPLRSYLQFSDAAWLGQDLVAGMHWALAHPGDALARIRRGQELVKERFAVDSIGQQWYELFANLMSSQPH